MPLKFFNNAINNGMCPQPDRAYRELAQAFISQTWTNTTARTAIEEQNLDKENNIFDNFSFHKIEVWLNYVVGQTSSGLKNGDDFVQIAFESIDHPCLKGRYYKFDNNYWLAYFTNEYDSVAKTLAVRRCNNWLKMIDPKSGKLYSIPCVVGYEMSSPSTQVSRYIITPNNHATVIVQGNSDTNRLFKLNTRFILGGRPFKLYGKQNAMLDNINDEEPNVLYLDLFLDEIHSGDDLENQIADNGEYTYSIKINSENMELPRDSVGLLDVDVNLNGSEVDRNVIWSSSSKAVDVTEKGEYKVFGEVGTSAIIRATLDGNDKVFDEITITVGDMATSEPVIVLNPDFTKIRQYENIEIDMTAVLNGVEYDPTETFISLSPDSIILNSNELSIVKNNNKYTIICNRFSKTTVNLYLSVSNNAPFFSAKETKTIKLVSMLG